MRVWRAINLICVIAAAAILAAAPGHSAAAPAGAAAAPDPAKETASDMKAATAAIAGLNAAMSACQPAADNAKPVCSLDTLKLIATQLQQTQNLLAILCTTDKTDDCPKLPDAFHPGTIPIEYADSDDQAPVAAPGAKTKPAPSTAVHQIVRSASAADTAWSHGQPGAVAYLTDDGTPIDLSGYDWLACKQSSGNDTKSPAEGSGQSFSNNNPLATILRHISGSIVFAGDEYSLAYQNACTPESHVPNDPAYSNNGLSLALSYNGFSTSGSGASAKTSSAGSGQMIGAVSLNPYKLFGFQPPPGSPNIYPFVGIDYQFNEKSTATDATKLTTSYNTKQWYYGLAFSKGFDLISEKDCSLLPLYDVGGVEGDIYSPIAPNGIKDLTSAELADIKPTSAASSTCEISAGDHDTLDSTLAGYYVWETNKKGWTYVNLTLDAFSLQDQIENSRLLVASARVVPFGLFSIPGLGRAFGINQFGRPPIYISGYPTDLLLGGYRTDNIACEQSTLFCGFDLHLWTDTRLALIADARIDAGHFLDRGLPQAIPSLSEDYVRVGGRFGAVVEINILRNNPIALQATYLDYAPLSGFSGDLGLTQFEIDYSFPNLKQFIFAVSYEDGRNQNTAQRVKDWMFSLKVTPQ